MAKVFANSGDSDQTPRSAASDLGLHCLPITLLGVSRLQWDNYTTALSLPGNFEWTAGSYLVQIWEVSRLWRPVTEGSTCQ